MSLKDNFLSHKKFWQIFILLLFLFGLIFFAYFFVINRFTNQFQNKKSYPVITLSHDSGPAIGLETNNPFIKINPQDFSKKSLAIIFDAAQITRDSSFGVFSSGNRYQPSEIKFSFQLIDTLDPIAQRSLSWKEYQNDQLVVGFDSFYNQTNNQITYTIYFSPSIIKDKTDEQLQAWALNTIIYVLLETSGQNYDQDRFFQIYQQAQQQLQEQQLELFTIHQLTSWAARFEQLLAHFQPPTVEAFTPRCSGFLECQKNNWVDCHCLNGDFCAHNSVCADLNPCTCTKQCDPTYDNTGSCNFPDQDSCEARPHTCPADSCDEEGAVDTCRWVTPPPNPTPPPPTPPECPGVCCATGSTCTGPQGPAADAACGGTYSCCSGCESAPGPTVPPEYAAPVIGAAKIYIFWDVDEDHQWSEGDTILSDEVLGNTTVTVEVPYLSDPADRSTTKPGNAGPDQSAGDHWRVIDDVAPLGSKDGCDLHGNDNYNAGCGYFSAADAYSCCDLTVVCASDGSRKGTVLNEWPLVSRLFDDNNPSTPIPDFDPSWNNSTTQSTGLFYIENMIRDYSTDKPGNFEAAATYTVNPAPGWEVSVMRYYGGRDDGVNPTPKACGNDRPIAEYTDGTNVVYGSLIHHATWADGTALMVGLKEVDPIPMPPDVANGSMSVTSTCSGGTDTTVSFDAAFFDIDDPFNNLSPVDSFEDFETNQGFQYVSKANVGSTYVNPAFDLYALSLTRSAIGDSYAATPYVNDGASVQGKTYTLSFSARADSPTTINGIGLQSHVIASNANPEYLFASPVNVTTTWKRFVFQNLTFNQAADEFRLVLRPADTVGAPVYFDGVLIEADDPAEPSHPMGIYSDIKNFQINLENQVGATYNSSAWPLRAGFNRLTNSYRVFSGPSDGNTASIAFDPDSQLWYLTEGIAHPFGNAHLALLGGTDPYGAPYTYFYLQNKVLRAHWTVRLGTNFPANPVASPYNFTLWTQDISNVQDEDYYSPTVETPLLVDDGSGGNWYFHRRGTFNYKNNLLTGNFYLDDTNICDTNHSLNLHNATVSTPNSTPQNIDNVNNYSYTPSTCTNNYQVTINLLANNGYYCTNAACAGQFTNADATACSRNNVVPGTSANFFFRQYSITGNFYIGESSQTGLGSGPCQANPSATVPTTSLGTLAANPPTNVNVFNLTQSNTNYSLNFAPSKDIQLQFTPNAGAGNTIYSCSCPAGCQYSINSTHDLEDYDFYLTEHDISNATSWWQVMGANVYATGLISTAIPTGDSGGEYCDDPTNSCQAGMILRDLDSSALSSAFPMTAGNDIDEAGFIHSREDARSQADNANALGTILPEQGYAEFIGRFTEPADLINLSQINLEETTPDGGKAYLIDGDATFSPADTLVIDGGQRIVVFIRGNLIIGNSYNLNRLIQVAEDSYLAIIVNGNIEISYDVGYDLATNQADFEYTPIDLTDPLAQTAYPPNLEGVYVADGSITIMENPDPSVADRKFIGAGTFVGWGGVDLQRSFDDDDNPAVRALNNLNPTEVFIFRPDLVEHTPNRLKSSISTWREANPTQD